MFKVMIAMLFGGVPNLLSDIVLVVGSRSVRKCNRRSHSVSQLIAIVEYVYTSLSPSFIYLSMGLSFKTNTKISPVFCSL